MNIGAAVFCVDGEAGRLEKVVVEPESKEITHLIVARGLLATRRIVVPRSFVAETGHDRVRLSLTKAQLEALPDVVQDQLLAPTEGWEPPKGLKEGQVVWWGTNPAIASGPPFFEPFGVTSEPLVVEERVNTPPGSVSLTEGTAVDATDGRIGSVDELVVDPVAERTTHLVVRRNGFFPKDVVIPVDLIAEVTPERVILKISKSELAKLPSHHR